jgi:DNA-binding NarL/FixJ family response regulator
VRPALIADGEAQVRSALRLLLQSVGGLRVVGEVATTDDLVAAVRAAAPRIVLLDWRLRGAARAGELVALLHQLPAPPRVVALYVRPEDRDAARAANVDAVVCKGDPPDALMRVLMALD